MKSSLNRTVHYNNNNTNSTSITEYAWMIFERTMVYIGSGGELLSDDTWGKVERWIFYFCFSLSLSPYTSGTRIRLTLFLSRKKEDDRLTGESRQARTRKRDRQRKKQKVSCSFTLMWSSVLLCTLIFYSMLFVFTIIFLSFSLARSRALSLCHWLALACFLLSRRVPSYLKLKFSPFICCFYVFLVIIIISLWHTLANPLINSSFSTCQYSRDRTSYPLLLPLLPLSNIVKERNIAADEKGQRERMFFSLSSRVDR